jgi:hypothetical protein
MAKVTISRIFEVSKYLSTEAGQDLREALVYLSEFAEVTVRNLRKGLNYTDNFDVIEKTVRLRENRETVILVNDSRRVKEIQIRRIVDEEYYLLSSFGWKYNQGGEVVVKARFDGTPANDRDVTVVVLVHFG